MDDATADLILSLQWQDLSDSAERDASLADQLISDYIVAIDFYKRELEGLATNIVDHHFSETLANSTNENEHLKPVNPLPKFEEVKNTLSRLCVTCHDYFPVQILMIAPCGDNYCGACTHELFDASMKDESLFPPRCCGRELVLDSAKALFPHQFTADFLEHFQVKSIEFNTTDRTYCHGASCSQFITPDHIRGDIATCGNCQLETCTFCKGRSHEGDCPEDPAFASLMTVARIEGYQRCYQCRRLVELVLGCNHIT